MEKYCPKPHPVYFNAFSMWQQLSGSVQYLISIQYTFICSYVGLSVGTNQVLKNYENSMYYVHSI